MNAVATLRDSLGAPLQFNRARRGYEYTDPTFALPAVLLVEGELLAMLLAEQVSRHYLGTPLEQPLRAAIEKLSRYLPEGVAVNPEALGQAFHFTGGSSLEVPWTLMTDAVRAIRERRVLRIEYYTAARNEVNEREIEPHFLQNVRGDWLLVAWDRLRDADRMFMLARVREHAFTGERFERREALQPGRYNADVFLIEHGASTYPVAIRFSAHQARWIRERRWHQSQRLEEQPDGSLILHLEVSGEGDLLRWVLGYGEHAEVLAPDWLRDRAATAARAMAAAYASPPTP
jgi:predicted DNA-binding transcriptional regulator YafY